MLFSIFTAHQNNFLIPHALHEFAKYLINLLFTRLKAATGTISWIPHPWHELVKYFILFNLHSIKKSTPHLNCLNKIIFLSQSLFHFFFFSKFDSYKEIEVFRLWMSLLKILKNINWVKIIFYLFSYIIINSLKIFVNESF